MMRTNFKAEFRKLLSGLRQDYLKADKIFLGKEGLLIIIATIVSSVTTLSLVNQYGKKELVRFGIDAFQIAFITLFVIMLIFILFGIFDKLSHFIIYSLFPKKKK